MFKQPSSNTVMYYLLFHIILIEYPNHTCIIKQISYVFNYIHWYHFIKSVEESKTAPNEESKIWYGKMKQEF